MSDDIKQRIKEEYGLNTKKIEREVKKWQYI